MALALSLSIHNSLLKQRVSIKAPIKDGTHNNRFFVESLSSKATGSTSSLPGATQQTPRDMSIPYPKAWTAAAPWMSHQFCRLQIEKQLHHQTDVFTSSKNLGQHFGFSGFLEMWTSSGKLR
ncbi:unnamed protein product [Caenorhabditis nigoni]